MHESPIFVCRSSLRRIGPKDDGARQSATRYFSFIRKIAGKLLKKSHILDCQEARAQRKQKTSPLAAIEAFHEFGLTRSGATAI
jgi:hypothetical protein